MSVTASAAFGPLFVISIAYSTSVPVSTVSGTSPTVTVRSATGVPGATVTVTGAVDWLLELSESGVALEAVAVFEMIDWSPASGATCTTMVVVRDSPAAVGPVHVHETVPVPPWAGAVHDPPVLAVAESEASQAGCGSEIVTTSAERGPVWVAESV
jgi:hypothetical protein